MWANVLDKIKNDSHIPIALLVFAVTTVAAWIKGDIGPNYVNSLYAMYGFLAAHGGAMMWGKVKEGTPDDSPADAAK